MLVESFVGIMALIAATALMPGDYFAINTPPKVFATLGYKIHELPYLSNLVGEDVAGRPGGAVSLAVGMAYIFAKLPGMEKLMSYWYQFAIMFEALFILTTIDAGTRVARYIAQDMLGMFYAPLKRTNWWPGIIFTSALVSFAWGYMLYGGSVSTIWPIFGVANQLLATMALCIGTTMILKKTRNLFYASLTFLPMVFLLATTVTAGIKSIISTYIPKAMLLNTVLMSIMIVLMIIIALDSARKWIEVWGKITADRGR